jgi:hypothetical protein
MTIEQYAAAVEDSIGAPAGSVTWALVGDVYELSNAAGVLVARVAAGSIGVS